MSAWVVGLCASASGGAVLGLLTGTMLASGKLRDLELAYSRLSEGVHSFLRVHLVKGSRLVPISEDDLQHLRQSLAEADVLAGLRESAAR